MIKQCLICKKEFETTGLDNNRLYCHECSPAGDGSKTLYQKQKELLVNLLGGKCEICGYNRTINALEFHHINPKEKEFTFGSKTQQLLPQLEEIHKCILLCSNCHKEYHTGLIILPTPNYDKLEKHMSFLRNVSKTQDLNKNHCQKCGKEISYGAKQCNSCKGLEHRVVLERPSRIELVKEIVQVGFLQTGRKYGVSDNAIRKWCVSYGVPKTIKELKEWYRINKDSE